MPSRRSITNAQRRALRQWFFSPSHEQKTHVDASTWWERTYGYYLNSSTVSEILSYKYEPLDDASAADPSFCQVDTRKRQRPPKWESVEEELITWVFWYESVAGEGSVTGTMLKQRGAELWDELESHRGLAMPKWSEGWLGRFRERYAIRKQKLIDNSEYYGASSNSGSSQGSFT